jgi:DNA primase
MSPNLSPEEVEACRHVPLHLIVGHARIDKKVKIKCPFHPDRTPSCTLFPNGGYHCFGCRAKGNSIDFLVNLGADYKEALTELKKYI